MYFHEIKELILESLLFTWSIISRFLSEEQVGPFFWLTQKVSDIIEQNQLEKVFEKKLI